MELMDPLAPVSPDRADRPPYGALARKYSTFTFLLISWVCFIFLFHDIESLRVWKIALVVGVVAVTAYFVGRFTNELMARPLHRLQQGVEAVRQGRLEPIRISRTRDEIEYLGHSLNMMIAALAESRREVAEYQELLEERIRQRTEALEEAMQRALAATRAKSEFLANVSHELRTPMVGILGMVDIVLEDKLTPPQRENLEIANSCARTLLALLNDVLDLAKIEAGHMTLEEVSFDLHELAADCVRSQYPNTRDKQVDVRLSIRPQVQRHVMGDPLRLRQVLTNLLSNGVKFTESGWVELAIHSEEVTGAGAASFVFSVRDTGIGIPAEKLRTIFEDFTQADGSTSRKYGGTGLGLAITRRLVGLFDGTISVESELGHGSEFRVEIPLRLATRPEASAPVPASRVAVRNGAPVRVLVVEDNLINQRVVSTVLRKAGYEVSIASNGEEALRTLDGGAAYALVLMDVQMPVLDGLEATRRIRADARWRRLPILALTAHALTSDRERCLQAGMNGYIAKPIMPADLLETVGHYVQGAGAEGESTADETPSEPIDAALARRLMEDEPHLIFGLAEVFIQMAPERLGRLRAAMRRRDPGQVRQYAQKLGKAAERIAAVPLAQCARGLAETAAEEDYRAMQEQLFSLERELKRLDHHIHAEMV